MTYVDELKEHINELNSPQKIIATIYARVSTRNEGQKESCDNQIKSAKEFLASFKNVTLSEEHIFKDEGLSGKSVVKRKEYQHLMDEVRSRKINLIVAKTCSRLFRSVSESQDFLKTLLKNKVTLFTLEDNRFWDFNMHTDELMFTLNSVFAAGTSRTQSDAGHLAQERRIKDKKLYPKDIVTGYKWDPDKKDIVIDTELSPYIVEMYEDYVYHNGTPSSICNTLKNRGIKFPKNKRDKDTREPYVVYEYLCEKTISKIISNPKYIGLFTINTRSSIFIPGEESKRYKTEKKDQAVIERPDLKIIDTDLFNMAQRIHKSRINIYKAPGKEAIQARFRGKHLYAGKIFCPLCGKPYHFGYADRKKSIPVYKIKKHSECHNSVRQIYEADLENVTKMALKQIIDQQQDVCISLERVLTEIVEASQDNNNEIDKLKKQKCTRDKQLGNLIDQLTEGGLIESARNRIIARINEITVETDRLAEIIDDKERNRLDDSYVEEKILKIKAAIADLRNFTTIDRDRILNYIEKIEMPPDGNIIIILKTGQILHINTSVIYDGNNVETMGTQDVPYSLR